MCLRGFGELIYTYEEIAFLFAKLIVFFSVLEL